MSGEVGRGFGVGKTGQQEKVSDDVSGATLIERTKKKLFESKPEPIKKEEKIVGIDVKKLVKDFEGLEKKSLNEQKVGKLLDKITGVESKPEIISESIAPPPVKIKKPPSGHESESIPQEREQTESEEILKLEISKQKKHDHQIVPTPVKIKISPSSHESESIPREREQTESEETVKLEIEEILKQEINNQEIAPPPVKITRRPSSHESESISKESEESPEVKIDSRLLRQFQQMSHLQISKVLGEMNPSEALAHLNEYSSNPYVVGRVLKNMKPELVVEILNKMEPDKEHEILNELKYSSKITPILKKMEPEKVIEFLKQPDIGLTYAAPALINFETDKIIEVLNTKTPEEKNVILLCLPPEKTAEILNNLPVKQSFEILKNLDTVKIMTKRIDDMEINMMNILKKPIVDVSIILKEMDPEKAAKIMGEISRTKSKFQILERIHSPEAAKILENFEPYKAKEVMEMMKTSKAARIFDNMEPNKALEIINSFGSGKQTEILSKMKPEKAQEIKDLMN